jgi:hypothetical protein
MKRQLNIQVEPLSEQRWERLERSLMSRYQTEIQGQPVPLNDRPLESGLRKGGLRKGGRADLASRAWMAVAAVAALVLIGVLAAGPAEQPAALDQPSRITTGPSPSHLALPGLALEVQPESTVVVGAETPQGQLLVLDAGSIVCRVAPRDTEAPRIVQAGAVRVRVVGTRFSVTRLGEGARVKVYEGVVEVRSGSESARVRAGEEWPKQSADPSRRHSAKSDESSSKLAPAEDAERDAGPSAPEPKPKKASQSERESRVHPPETTSDPVKRDVSSRRTSQEIFEQATALESSDPARASRLYRQLESRGDSWSQNALYARGRLAASHGDSAAARRLLERYLERFPSGSNAEDARAVLRRLR